MNLTKFLREQNYDLIDGPIRNQMPLQLWLKRPFNSAELYYAHISHAFTSAIPLEEIENTALAINSDKKDEYGFNVGITALEDVLKSIGLGAVELNNKIKSGKKVTISYDNSHTKEYAVGNIESYLSSADFVHPNPPLLRNSSRNNLIVLSGIVFAKNLVVDIETDFKIETALIASLNEMAEGNVDFTMSTVNKIKMVSSVNNFFPIAVKANRIDYDKGRFRKLNLISDNRDLF